MLFYVRAFERGRLFAALALARLRSPAVACGRLRSPAVACLRTPWRPKAAISPRFGWTGDFCALRCACVGCLGCFGDCEKRRAVLFVLQDVFGPLLGIFTLMKPNVTPGNAVTRFAKASIVPYIAA